MERNIKSTFRFGVYLIVGYLMFVVGVNFFSEGFGSTVIDSDGLQIK